MFFMIIWHRLNIAIRSPRFHANFQIQATKLDGFSFTQFLCIHYKPAMNTGNYYLLVTFANISHLLNDSDFHQIHSKRNKFRYDARKILINIYCIGIFAESF